MVQRRMGRPWAWLRAIAADRLTPFPLASATDAGRLPSDFDAARYIALNPDLAHLQHNLRKAARHFVVHGAREGRNYRQAIATSDHLPNDFDADTYVALNPDLAAKHDPAFSPENHYLQSGRREGRPYRLDTERFGQLPADFDADTYVELNPDLDGLSGQPLAAARHYLAEGRSEGRPYKIATRLDRQARPGIEARSPPGDWRSVFKPGDFRTMRPDLAGAGTTREALLAAFEARGIDALVPLSHSVSFDPDFYAWRYVDAASLTPVERYRHWLEVGLPAGRPGTERDAVANLIGQSEYPESFDWRRYTATLPRPDRRSWTRLEALEHLMTVGLTEAIDAPVSGPGAARFRLVLSDAMWRAGRLKLALRSLAAALDADPSDGELHSKMAQRCVLSGLLTEAERHEARALALGQDSVDVYANLIDLASGRGDAADSYRLLAQSKARFEGVRSWRDGLQTAVERDYAQTAERAWTLYGQGQREAADALMVEGLTRITDSLRSLEDLPGRVGPDPGGHVVLFANHVLPQCRHYRIEQRCRQFAHLGIPCKVFSSDDTTGAREALVGARALLVYREPAFPPVVRLLLHARAMGLPTIYDIDDLIFDAEHYPEGFAAYAQQISFEAYVGLLYGVPLIRFAISLCDTGMASTSALAAHVAPLTREARCHVVPNGLDDRNARFLDAPARPTRSEADDIVVFYGSGSQAHNRNFNETVGPALLSLLAKDPRVRLVVAGYLDLDAAFDPFADRIRVFPFSQDLEAYWALLSEVDINLAVLTPGAMNDGKSEIKWLEAAVSSVPSIVSASARYREVVRDGIDGLLADSPEAWTEALSRLVEDPALRRRIGAQARARALADYALASTANLLAAALEPRHLPAAAPRTRLLVVHVLFPPQSSGGATRVVRDNIDDLLDRYGDDFDVAVYTTDFDAPVHRPDEPTDDDHELLPEADVLPEAEVLPSSRIGRYRSIPVFRVSRSTDSEYTYRDERIGRHFGDVLRSWKPDIVHIHCIQFLTGAVVEACRIEGVPYVVTLHDAWWISPHQFLIDDDGLLRAPGPRAVDDAPASMTDIDRRRYLADQLAGAAALLAVSESFAQIYRDAGFPETRAVPNGLSAAFLARPPRTPTAGPRVRIGHIGGLPPHKGSHLLRLALEGGDYRNIEAVVVDHAQPSDYRHAVTWGHTPVVIRGPTDQDGVVALYEDLDVVVAPSIWPESYGLVAREAMAMELWVVASDLGAIAEDVIEGENGFVVDVKDARGLSRALRLIDSDPARYRAPPQTRFEPRPASAQTDDLVILYRDLASARTRI